MSVLCLVGCAITWPILFPIHIIGGAGNKQLDALSFSNVQNPQLYYGHVVVAWIFFGTRIGVLHDNARKHPLCHVEAGVSPFSFVCEPNIVSHSFIPGCAETIPLQEEAVQSWLIDWRRPETTYIKRAHAAHLKSAHGGLNDSRSSINTSPVEVEKGLQQFPTAADVKRPSHRLGLMFGKRVDTIDWLRAQLKEAIPQIEKLQQGHRAGKEKPASAVFIEFGTQMEAQIAFQTLSHHHPFQMTPRFIGISPNQVIWPALQYSWWQRIVRKFLVQGFITVLIIFWSIPSAFVGSISNITYLANLLPFLKFIDSLPAIVKGAISGVLPTVALALLMALVPIFLRWCARQSGLPSTAQVELFTQNAHFVFQVVQVFLVTTITSAASAATSQIIKDPLSAKDLLANNLPKASNFYISYFLFQGLILSSAAVMQVITFLVFKLLRVLFDKTPRKLYQRWAALAGLSWGTVFPVFTNMVVIAITYSCIAPLILGFSAFGLYLVYQAYRYNLLFVYDSIVDTKGLIYPRALQQVLTGIYLAEICMIGLFAVREAIGPLILMAIFTILTILAHISLNDALAPLLSALPRTLDNECDAEEEILEGIDRGFPSGSANDPEKGEFRTEKPHTECSGRRVRMRKAFLRLMTWLLHPSAYADYTSLRRKVRQDPGISYDPNIDDNAYHPPWVTAPTPLLWVPRDIGGISRQEVLLTRTVVPITDEEAYLDEKNKVVWDKLDDSAAPAYIGSMADPSSGIPQSSPQRNRHPSRPQGGRRGRGGGSHPPMTSNSQSQRGSRGASRSRGAGRDGRGTKQGGRSADRRPAANDDDTGGEPPGRGLRGDGTSSDRLTGDAKGSEGESAGKETAATDRAAADDADDSDVCFICTSKIEHLSIAPCNHRTCHICSLRMRALYKTKACAHCRTESSFVIFTDDRGKRYEEFTDKGFIRTDDNLGIKYETHEIFEDTVLLLRYNCPDKDCDIACLGDLCTRNKKVFTHEHELFSMAQLRKHEKYGDDNPGALDQSGFKGHPECGFCHQRFYGDDELFAHCRDKHERCHICDRRTGGSRPQYYVNYNALEEHFSKDHFLCLDKECLEKKFVVFESQMDLKAHQLECHPAGLSKDARRDARHVDMSTFDYRAPYQPRRRDGRRPLGRDPNSEPLPPSSAQPLRRDELAYQRQLAVQSAQSISQRSFGGQLTQPHPQTQPVRPSPAPSATSQPQLAVPPPPSIENLDLNAPAATPQEEARRIAHAAVMDRASSLLRHDALKIDEFRKKVSLYRSSRIEANELIESFFSLFDTSSTDLGKLVKELAHLYEDDSKRTGLLAAWNDWRAINEDYPALPGPSGVMPSTSLPNVGGGKRVLRLKSSTAQSSRSAVAQNPRLPGLLNPTSASNPFPSLPNLALKSQKGASSNRVWGTVPTPPASTPKTSPVPSRSASRAVVPTSRTTDTSEAFPALPAAPKPNVLMAGLTRGTVRWGAQGAGRGSTPAWGANNPTPAEVGADAGEASQKGKGKKGKGKQVLYHFG
ncbi:conserved hypothetical protein [Uncinocarpus reesii 1704]|uniref:RING-type E3 ubiquitin transferase n=1 Tax=Uncinocarpus reesii (strain UAMH 1704) TaxID=336963 RepID=C4JUA1_UNCRE|nr:uncharacterized protein UREG_06040 [Uncinocarpus reesii 1704]EEP81198.1 conserved hypothetical protein [Uncinocarpus reesii 1704]